MIFSKKINKIPTGDNLTLYQTSSNSVNAYLFNDSTIKYQIEFKPILKSINSGKKYNYNSIIQLNSEFLCVCFDNNMSIVKNEEN